MAKVELSSTLAILLIGHPLIINGLVQEGIFVWDLLPGGGRLQDLLKG